MGLRLASRMTAVAAIAALTSCTHGTAMSPDSTGTTDGGAPVVSLLTPSAGRIRIIGGTADMRARARSILDGMGDVAIVEVRFGHPPASFPQFRGVRRPIWLSTTVRAGGAPFSHGIRRQLLADGPLWQASVFENAYLGSQPTNAPRIRGTSESIALPAGIRRWAAGTASMPRYSRGAPSVGAARAGIERAAAAAHFGIVSISFIHPDRPAATVIMRATSRTSFLHRYLIFHHRLTALTGRLGGLQWEIVDRCGFPVALQTAASWVNPRWVCPNPFIIGLASKQACRKLVRAVPPCAR
jgi:hypothetical protein